MLITNGRGHRKTFETYILQALCRQPIYMLKENVTKQILFLMC